MLRCEKDAFLDDYVGVFHQTCKVNSKDGQEFITYRQEGEIVYESRMCYIVKRREFIDGVLSNVSHVLAYKFRPKNMNDVGVYFSTNIEDILKLYNKSVSAHLGNPPKILNDFIDDSFNKIAEELFVVNDFSFFSWHDEVRTPPDNSDELYLENLLKDMLDKDIDLAKLRDDIDLAIDFFGGNKLNMLVGPVNYVNGKPTFPEHTEEQARVFRKYVDDYDRYLRIVMQKSVKLRESLGELVIETSKNKNHGVSVSDEELEQLLK